MVVFQNQHYIIGKKICVILSGTEIHRNRFPISRMIIKNEIWKFIQNYCRPSTDLRKVKVINNELYQTHYRVTTIDELYIQFVKQNPWDFSISQSAFYIFLPKWLLVRKK